MEKQKPDGNKESDDISKCLLENHQADVTWLKKIIDEMLAKDILNTMAFQVLEKQKHNYVTNTMETPETDVPGLEEEKSTIQLESKNSCPNQHHVETTEKNEAEVSSEACFDKNEALELVAGLSPVVDYGNDIWKQSLPWIRERF